MGNWSEARGTLECSEARSLLSVWSAEQKPLFCVSHSPLYTNILTAFVMSVSHESFTLRSIRSDCSQTCFYSAKGVVVDYVLPVEFQRDIEAPDSIFPLVTGLFPTARPQRIPTSGLPFLKELSPFIRGLRIKLPRPPAEV